MGEILRRSVLTKAGSDLNSEKWDDQKWSTTHSFLLSSFGVKTDIIRDQLHFLEMFKEVEMSGLDRVRAHKVNELDLQFANDWAKMVTFQPREI